MRQIRVTGLVAAVAAALAAPVAIAASSFASLAAPAPTSVRFATFNASLNRDFSGQLLADLTGTSIDANAANRAKQLRNVAEVVQRVRPDVLLVNEFDFDLNGTPTASSTMMPLGYSSHASQLFQNNFLGQGQGNATRGTTAPITFAHRYTPNTNTGLASGKDLDNNGSIGGGNDAFGFGNFGGQFGMTVYSRFPIVGVRTFQSFLWKDMPNNLLTNDPTAGPNNLANFYSTDERSILRLSSKNHVDVTINVNGQLVSFLSAHPTPPVFDGPEDRNGKRNHDEIRFWKDYIAGGAGASYIYDDAGGTGGLPAGRMFVIAGDYNADPNDGDAYNLAIRQLLDNPLVNASMTPESLGGPQRAGIDGLKNATHVSDPRFDTADFADSGTNPGNLRVDYVLPSATMPIAASGVFWPFDENTSDNNDSGTLIDLVGSFGRQNLYAGFPTSDHKAVWIDAEVAAVPEPETYALMLAGLGLVGWAARRRKRKA